MGPGLAGLAFLAIAFAGVVQAQTARERADLAGQGLPPTGRR